MKEWITQVMESSGYVGIFLMMALENVFPPIPSEIVLPFSGFMTTTSELTVTGMIVASTGGSLFGAVILYYVGVAMDVEKLERFLQKYGHRIRIKIEDVHRADQWFDRYGIWTVFLCRMVPLIRSLISVPAGMSNMPITLFIIFTTLGTVIWNTILITLGAKLGDSWEEITAVTEVYSTYTYIAIAGLFILFVLYYFRKKKKS